MAEQNVTGNGRKLVEYRSVITLGNLLSIVTIVVTVSAGAIWWNGDVQARLATLETKMEFTEGALAAMAQKMGIELTELDAERRSLHPPR
jgi:hypothetical protein